MKRRFFLFAAPAIVAAPSLMRVSAAVLDTLTTYSGFAPVEMSLNGLMTATLLNRSRKLADSVMRNNVILRIMTSRDAAFLPLTIPQGIRVTYGTGPSIEGLDIQI